MSSPAVDLLLRDLILRNVSLYGRDVAVCTLDESLTWQHLASRSFQLANRLSELGIDRGSRLAVLQQNGIELIEISNAAALLGAVVVPISTRATRDEIDFLVQDSGCRLAFVEDGHPCLGAFANLKVISTRSDEYAEFRDGGDTTEPPERERPDDPVYQLYTSGTTGRPKGVLLTQRAMILNGLTVQLSQQLRHDDVFLSATPLTHAAAGTRIFSLAIDGIQHVVLERFTTAAFFEAVERHRVTTSIVVPTMLQDLLADPALATSDLSSLRLLLYGAAPSSPDLVTRALDTLPCGLAHGYGLTEGCPALTMLTADEHRRFAAEPDLRHRLSSIGRPVPGVRVKVASSDGSACGPHEVGELLVRSGKVMLGYWHNPEATAETMPNGWLATGDMATQDEDGYLYLVDRKKDVLISGGLNVYPAEVERVLCEQPHVREAAVIGVPSERWGEVPIAFVVAEGGDIDVARTLDGCKQSIAGYKQPRRLLVVDALPRTASGKVMKHVLRSAFLANERASAQP